MGEIKNNILYGGKVALPKNCNYGKFVLDKFRNFGDKDALIDGVTGEKIKFNHIVQQAMNLAASLTNIGVKKGDVVAICSENRIEFLITSFAVMYIGAVANFINKAYSTDEMIHALAISRPKYIFMSPETYKSYGKIMTHLVFIQVFVYGKVKAQYVTRYEDLVKYNVNIDDVKEAIIEDGKQTAILIYSSGTTGLPKGVKWTHQGLVIANHQPICTDQNLVTLTIAPWTNTMGYMVTNDSLTKGILVVSLTRYNEQLYLETIEKYKVGILIAPPPLIVMLSKSTILKNYDVSSVEIINSGGAPLEAKVIVEVKKRLPNLRNIFQTYGMSEATGAVTKEIESAHKHGSVGKVMHGLNVKVVDIETRKPLGPNQPGEVCVNGPALFGGYIGKAVKDVYDEEGFYKTGDIAYYDEEGYIFVVDRLKELIKYKGYQVGPTELEGVLLQHPAVKDAGVIGVPDEVAGELPLAFVVKQPGAQVTEKQIVDYVASKVSSWKKLRGGVRFVPEIPKNPSGKILRRELRQLVEKPKSKL